MSPKYGTLYHMEILMENGTIKYDKLEDLPSLPKDWVRLVHRCRAISLGRNIVNNIKEEDNGVKVYIGSETEFDDDVTIIKTKYNVNGEEGTLAIVGPKRMEYNRAMMLLEYLKNNIENL